jgi:hypothetical protein
LKSSSPPPTSWSLSSSDSFFFRPVNLFKFLNESFSSAYRWWSSFANSVK